MSETTGYDNHDRQRVLEPQEIEFAQAELKRVSDELIRRNVPIKGHELQILEEFAAASFNPKIRRWAKDYVDLIVSDADQLISDLNSGESNRLSSLEGWPEFQRTVPEYVAPVAWWIEDPGPLLRVFTSSTIRHAQEAQGQIDELLVRLSRTTQDVASLGYLAELEAERRTQTKTAGLWLAAALALSMVTLLMAIWVFNGLEIGWMRINWSRPGDDTSEVARVAPTAAVAASAAWAGREYGRRSAQRFAYRERFVRLRTMESIATSTELSKISRDERGRDSTLVRDVLINVMAEPIDGSSDSSGPGTAETIKELFRRESDS